MLKLFIAIAMLSIYGCNSDVYSYPTSKDGLTITSYAVLWVDPMTKCEYVTGSLGHGYTPRLDRNGKQICR